LIISHRYKYIFLKTTKTAGTSTEIALSQFCGPDDIITPVLPEDEALRRELGYPGPQNYGVRPIWRYGISDWGRLLLLGKRALFFYNHIPARLVRERIGEEIWRTYFKFCVARNPWDRVISDYYWMHQSQPRPPIAQHMTHWRLRRLDRHGWGIYTIDGQVAVDKICRFERLTDDLEEVRQHVGLPAPLELPRAKSQYRTDKRKYYEVFSSSEAEKIARYFRDEIKLLGYEYRAEHSEGCGNAN